MRYPYLKTLPRTRRSFTAFYGLEHKESVRAGAFYDMNNLSSDAFPCLTVRADRKLWLAERQENGETLPARLLPAAGLTAAAMVNGALACATEDTLYYRGQPIANAPLDPAAENRRIIPMGRSFFVAPDGKFVQTDVSGAPTVTHAAFSQDLPGAVLSFADRFGVEVTLPEARLDPPASPVEGQTYTDASGEELVIMKYTGGQWIAWKSVYLKIAHADAGRFAVPEDPLMVIGIYGGFFRATVKDAWPGAVLLRTPAYDLPLGVYRITLRKRMPVLDLAVEHQNRIWGCRFGENAEGEFVNEIYASAPGDPTVWDRFDGVSTDCFAVSLGCPGPFTGAAVTGGELIFFKERYVIRVSGGAPQEYTVSVTPADGVKRGCADTCVALNEKICYLSGAGVAVYDGALPYTISESFPTEGIAGGAAAAFRGKYYLAARHEDGTRRLYVYDPAVGLWHTENDDACVRFFLPVGSMLFCLCRAEGREENAVIVLGARGDAPDIFDLKQEDVSFRFAPLPQKTWFAETGRLFPAAAAGMVRGLTFRLKLGEEAYFRAEICCDGKKWIPLCRVRRAGEDAFRVQVNTPRCESFRLRLSGSGDCTLYGLDIVSEAAGEVKGLV